MHSCEWCYNRKLLIHHLNRVYNTNFEIEIDQTPDYLDARGIAYLTRRRRGRARTRLSPKEQVKFKEKQDLLKVILRERKISGFLSFHIIQIKN